jgi:hypothetical protein
MLTDRAVSGYQDFMRVTGWVGTLALQIQHDFSDAMPQVPVSIRSALANRIWMSSPREHCLSSRGSHAGKDR